MGSRGSRHAARGAARLPDERLRLVERYMIDAAEARAREELAPIDHRPPAPAEDGLGLSYPSSRRGVLSSIASAVRDLERPESGDFALVLVALALAVAIGVAVALAK